MSAEGANSRTDWTARQFESSEATASFDFHYCGWLMHVAAQRLRQAVALHIKFQTTTMCYVRPRFAFSNIHGCLHTNPCLSCSSWNIEPSIYPIPIYLRSILIINLLIRHTAIISLLRSMPYTIPECSPTHLTKRLSQPKSRRHQIPRHRQIPPTVQILTKVGITLCVPSQIGFVFL